VVLQSLKDYHSSLASVNLVFESGLNPWIMNRRFHVASFLECFPDVYFHMNPTYYWNNNKAKSKTKNMEHQTNKKPKKLQAECWWLVPIILVTLEADYQEDHGSKPAWADSSGDTILEKPITKMG
jgi:hypothetical protein